MTTRAGSVRVAQPLFQKAGGGSSPTSALQLVFDTCSHEKFRDLNRLWHSRLPKGGQMFSRICYVAEFDGLYYAAAKWAPPIARELPQAAWLELQRFAIADDAPKNTASRMLGWMVRDIRKRFPHIERVISYQDCDVHTGTIYKASGWVEAEGYKMKPHGWEPGNGGSAKGPIGRRDQAIAPRMRWEKVLQIPEVTA